MDIYTANKLQQLRKKNNLSQEELANCLNISRQAVSKWERAESSPDTDNLIALAKLYRVSLDELLEINVKTQVIENERKIISLKKEKSTDEELEEIFSQRDEGEIYPQYNQDDIDYIQKDDAEEIYPQYNQQEKSVKSEEFSANNYVDNNTYVREEPKNILVTPKKKKKFFDFNENVGNKNINFRLLYMFPYYAVAIIMFFLGVSEPFCDMDFGHAWISDVSWLWFLTIPLYYSGVKALQKDNANYFLYPVLAIIFFFLIVLATSSVFSLASFATIPFYYFFVAVKREKKKRR